MAGSTFGTIFKITTWGESHGAAIGVVVEDICDGKRYYVTGDTLYNEEVFSSLPLKKFKAVFLPINGVGNNMNAVDAEKFAKRIKSKNVVPCHFGLFYDMTGEELKLKND